MSKLLDQASKLQGSQKPNLHQAVQIENALRVLKDLEDRGLIDKPAYRLAPIGSVPAKAFVISGASIRQKPHFARHSIDIDGASPY